MYVATFNYGTLINRAMDFDRLGLEQGTEYVVRELWGNKESIKTGNWTESIPTRDVKLFKIFPKNPTPQVLKEAVWKSGGSFPADWVIDGRFIWGDFNRCV